MLKPKGTPIYHMAKIDAGCYSELTFADLNGKPGIAEPLKNDVQVAYLVFPHGATSDPSHPDKRMQRSSISK